MECKFEEKVQGMCFDTTSDTSNRKRTCVNLEKLLGHDLLHIVCRHLILQNFTGAAFDEALGFLSVSVQLIKQVKNSKVNMQPLLLLILKTKN